MDNSQSTVCFEDCPISCTVLPGATTALYLWLWSVGRGGCERPHRWCHCPPVQESGIEAWLRVGSTCGQVLGGLPKHLADSCRTLTLCVFCNTHTHTHTHTSYHVSFSSISMEIPIATLSVGTHHQLYLQPLFWQETLSSFQGLSTFDILPYHPL